MRGRGPLLVAAALALVAALVALLWLLRGSGPRRGGAVAAPGPGAAAPEAAPLRPRPPQTPEGRQPVIAALEDAGPRVATPEPPADPNAPPPPVSALILTFPDGTSEETIQALYTRCGLVEQRRRGTFARVKWAEDRELKSVRQCLEWQEVSVTEERDPNAP